MPLAGGRATAVELWLHNSVLRAIGVGFANWMAMARAASADRYPINPQDIPFKTERFIYGIHELPVTWENPA